MGVASKCVAGLCTQRDERGEAVYIHSLLDSEVGSCVCMYVCVGLYVFTCTVGVCAVHTYLPTFLPSYLLTYFPPSPPPSQSLHLDTFI